MHLSRHTHLISERISRPNASALCHRERPSICCITSASVRGTKCGGGAPPTCTPLLPPPPPPQPAATPFAAAAVPLVAAARLAALWIACRLALSTARRWYWAAIEESTSPFSRSTTYSPATLQHSRHSATQHGRKAGKFQAPLLVTMCTPSSCSTALVTTQQKRTRRAVTASTPPIYPGRPTTHPTRAAPDPAPRPPICPLARLPAHLNKSSSS